MADEKRGDCYIPIQTVINNGQAEGYTNSCLFISIHQYLRYVLGLQYVSVYGLRQEANFVGFMYDLKYDEYMYTDNMKFDTENKKHVENLEKMLRDRKLRLRIYSVPDEGISFRDLDDKPVRVSNRIHGHVTTTCMQEYGDKKSRLTINVVHSGDHFELIVTDLPSDIDILNYQDIILNSQEVKWGLIRLSPHPEQRSCESPGRESPKKSSVKLPESPKNPEFVRLKKLKEEALQALDEAKKNKETKTNELKKINEELKKTEENIKTMENDQEKIEKKIIDTDLEQFKTVLSKARETHTKRCNEWYDMMLKETAMDMVIYHCEKEVERIEEQIRSLKI